MVLEKSIWYALTYYQLSKDDYVDKESGNTSDQQESQQYPGKESDREIVRKGAIIQKSPRISVLRRIQGAGVV